MLPFGTKSIPEIRQGTDDTTKLFELATLLEYLLKKRKPGLKSKNGGHMGLCERIKKNKDAFADMNSVIKAVCVRNDIAHASENGHTPRSIHQNYLHLMEGVIYVAKKMPIAIQRDVLNNSNLIMPKKSENEKNHSKFHNNQSKLHQSQNKLHDIKQNASQNIKEFINNPDLIKKLHSIKQSASQNIKEFVNKQPHPDLIKKLHNLKQSTSKNIKEFIKRQNEPDLFNKKCLQSTIRDDIPSKSIDTNKDNAANRKNAKNQTIERRQVNLYRMPKTIYPGFSMKLSVLLGVIFVLTGLFFAMGDHILRYLDIRYQVKTVQARKAANQCQRNISKLDIPDPLKKYKNELDDIFYNANNCFKKKTYLSLRNARHLYEIYAKKYYDLKDNIKHYKTHQKDLPAKKQDKWAKNSSQKNDQVVRIAKKVKTSKVETSKVEISKVEISKNISKQRIPKPDLITKQPKFRKPKRMKKAICVVSTDEAKKIFSPYLSPGLYVIGTVPPNNYPTPQPASYNNLIRLKVFQDFHKFIHHGTNPLNDRQPFSQSMIIQTEKMKHFFQIFQNMSNIFAQEELLKP